ncbi:hypothetical protein [Spiroplasma taiwanense]|uniref:hypothetical protein n=1 Tax=Spiroplasma taiwanense TaxID=2145 RepID=UPI00035A3750|nr:hypothetical protein [Spiroplasma taiwanense]
MWFVFVVIIAVVWIINEAIISFHDIENNDFYLRLNPKNWFKYDKKIIIEKFNNKKEINNNDKNIKKE